MSSAEQAQEWFYLDQSKEKQGPVSFAEFKTLADRGVLFRETLVWGTGYEDWLPAGEVAGLFSVRGPELADPPAPAKEEPAVEYGKQELKPRKGTFIFPRILGGVALAAFGSWLVAMFALTELIPLFIFWVYCVLAVALVVFSALVAHRKERYVLGEKVVCCYRGGLVSDQTTELEIRNITHVKVKLPWLRYKLFGVGNVLIESAGNAKPVILRAVYKPEEIYAEMARRMKGNGYRLSKEQLMHEENPAVMGAVIECLGVTITIAFVLPLFFGVLFVPNSSGERLLPEFWSLVIGSLLGLFALFFLVIHFLDLRRRTYQVFNDAVVYTEGFLTRQNAFIPYENIADAATKRTFIDQVLGLYDVLVSCQGSSSEIKFRRLKHGPQLSACIDRLVLEASDQKAKTKASGQMVEGASGPKLCRRDEPEIVAPREAWIADMKMNPARVFVPLLLLLPLLPVWVLVMIQAGIKLMATSYAIRPGSIRHSYRFFNTNDREFAYDKITGLVIKENLWDRLFGTVTLRFWSIGSGQSLELAHVMKNEINFEAINCQIGIPAPSARPFEATANCTLVSWLRARCFRLGFALLATIGLVIAGVQTGEKLFYGFAVLPTVICLIGFGYAWVYFRRQCFRLHDHHVEAEQGVITRLRYLARYRNVKKNTVTRYPGGNEGSLQIFVAGEQRVGQQQHQNTQKKGAKGVPVPCSFTLGFLREVNEKGQLLDDILTGRVDPAPDCVVREPLEVIMETKRGVGNSVVALLIFSIALVPLLVVLPLTLPLTIWSKKKWRYRVDEGRVIASWGIIFKKQTSILLDRIDSLRQEQGPLNKIFKNGNVSIMTAGSSKPDLDLAAALDYQPLYQEIRQHSQER